MDTSTHSLAQTLAAINTPGVFYTTRITDLAACLGALRVPIRKFERIREVGQPTEKAVVHYTFAGASDDQSIVSQVVAWQWEHRAKHEASHPEGDPLSWMRRGIESLRWIGDVHKGRVRFRPGVTSGSLLVANDVHLAACYKAADLRVARIDGDAKRIESVVFVAAADDPVAARVREDFARYENPFGPAAWMRRAFMVRAELNNVTVSRPGKPSALRVQTHYVRGNPLAGGSELYLYDEPAPGENRAAFETHRREALRIFRS